MALTIRNDKLFDKEIETLKTELNIKVASKVINYIVFNFLRLKDEIRQLNNEIKKLNKEKQEVLKQLSDTRLAIAKKIEAEEQLQKADINLNAIIFSPEESGSREPGLKNDSKISLPVFPETSAARNFDCKKEQESSHA